MVVCPSLTAPTNGAISSNGSAYGSSASFSCSTGYQISGSLLRTCQSNGTWSGSQSICNSRAELHNSIANRQSVLCPLLQSLTVDH